MTNNSYLSIKITIKCKSLDEWTFTIYPGEITPVGIGHLEKVNRKFIHHMYIAGNIEDLSPLIMCRCKLEPKNRPKGVLHIDVSRFAIRCKTIHQISSKTEIRIKLYQIKYNRLGICYTLAQHIPNCE